jgi:uncharacterized membrane-anchored protein YhcB (DUF1043 family)
VEAIANAAITHWGPLVIGWLLAAFLLWVVFKERKKVNGNGMYAHKKDFDDHREKTASHFALIEGRVADNYEEFLNFKVEVAKELASIDDLKATENRIKEHITLAMRPRSTR